MQADFSLEDPGTFQQVLPLQELGPGRRPKKTAAAGRNGESGKKNLSSPSANNTSGPPVSSKLLHEKVELNYCFSVGSIIFFSHIVFSTFLQFIVVAFCSPLLSTTLTPSLPPSLPPSPHVPQLSHYLDVIEVHLAHQIAQRSDLFFSTLSSQQELQSHIMSVRQNAVELRSVLSTTVGNH